MVQPVGGNQIVLDGVQRLGVPVDALVPRQAETVGALEQGRHLLRQPVGQEAPVGHRLAVDQRVAGRRYRVDHDRALARERRVHTLGQRGRYSMHGPRLQRPGHVHQYVVALAHPVGEDEARLGPFAAPHHHQMGRRHLQQRAALRLDRHELAPLVGVPVHEHEHLAEDGAAGRIDRLHPLADPQLAQLPVHAGLGQHGAVAGEAAACMARLGGICVDGERERRKRERETKQNGMRLVKRIQFNV